MTVRDEVVPPPPAAVRADGRAARVMSLLRAHGWIIAVLAAGLAVRGVVMAAYPEAFFYPDSRVYTTWALRSYPQPQQPYGYSFFLRPFVPGSMSVVAVVQHLMGLGLVLLGYLFLAGRGAPRWLAALAVVPIAVDGRQITLEHYVMAEILFLVLTAVALVVLASRPASWIAATAAGALLAGAALTRTVGLPLVVVALGYLLVRRVGWRSVLALAASAAVPLVGYLFWFHDAHGVYGFNQYQGRYLYARVQTFADCGRLELTPTQRTLCLDTPVSERQQRTDLYLWNAEFSPAYRYYRGLEHDPFLRGFAVAAITQQPWDYTVTVLRETSWHLAPTPPLDDRNRCLAHRWTLPDLPGQPCQAIPYTRTASTMDTPVPPKVGYDRLRAGLARYSSVVTMHGPLLAGCLLLVIVAVARGRRADCGRAWDAALFGGAWLALIAVSVATTMFETRYALPAAWLLPVAAALATTSLVARRPVRSGA